MGIFSFIKTTTSFSISSSFKPFVAPSSDKEYILIMVYYGNDAFNEGDYETSSLPYLFSDLLLYVRKKDNNDYSVFKYSGNVKIHRHTENSIRYDDIMNLTEISKDIQNEWDYLVQHLNDKKHTQ